ncbi:MAG: c-type cytochrome domain-containing protein, partial [Aureliella sp.]
MFPLLFAMPQRSCLSLNVPEPFRRALTTCIAVTWTFLIASNAAQAEAPKIEQSSSDSAAREKFFVQRVEPLLREHCFECHSHESGDSSGNLMLDSLAGMLVGGSRGTSIIPSQPDQSLLLHAILYTDSDLQMPPSEKLDDEAIGTFRTWLADGAAMPEALRGDLSGSNAISADDARKSAVQSHWSYQPPHRWETNCTSATASVNAIDAIVESKLAAANLCLSASADRTTLLRRLSYDLIGLPPTQA